MIIKELVANVELRRQVYKSSRQLKKIGLEILCEKGRVDINGNRMAKLIEKNNTDKNVYTKIVDILDKDETGAVAHGLVGRGKTKLQATLDMLKQSQGKILVHSWDYFKTGKEYKIPLFNIID